MNLVEAPDHAGPVAPPHAPERLRTLLAEGRNAQNDETAQSERAGFSPLKLNLDSYSESKDSNIFALGWSLWRGGSPSLVVFYSPLLLGTLAGMAFGTSSIGFDPADSAHTVCSGSGTHPWGPAEGPG